MSLSSIEFIVLVFVCAALYYIAPRRHAWIILLLASYVFYLSAGYVFLPFIAFTTLSTYITSILLSRLISKEKSEVPAKDESVRRKKREILRRKRLCVLLPGALLQVAVLVMLKCASPATRLIAYLTGEEKGFIALPLGISFYTLQSIGYLADVYRGRSACQKNPFRLALFVSYFPQLTLGPISRYSSLEGQLWERRSASWENICPGFLRMCFGYFKKIVIADALIIPTREVIEKGLGGGYVALLIVIYSVRIYADFTGGADIAIGVSRIFGIELAENFKRPFSSTSVKEFWNRWHVTLGTWFTDYVFYPLSLSKGMQIISRSLRKRFGNEVGKRVPVYTATVVTWSLTGLWHGFELNFLTWGLLNAVMLLVYQERQMMRVRSLDNGRSLESGRLGRSYLRAQTFVLIGAVRLLDLYGSVSVTFLRIGSIFYDVYGWRSLISGGIASIGLDLPAILTVGLGCLIVEILNKLEDKGDEPIFERMAHSPFVSSAVAVALIFALLVFGSYGIGYDAGEFIYTKF